MQKSGNYIISEVQGSVEKQARQAKVIGTNSLIQHVLPLVTNDHLGPFFRIIFLDSRCAKKLLMESPSLFDYIVWTL